MSENNTNACNIVLLI